MLLTVTLKKKKKTDTRANKRECISIAESDSGGNAIAKKRCIELEDALFDLISRLRCGRVLPSNPRQEGNARPAARSARKRVFVFLFFLFFFCSVHHHECLNAHVPLPLRPDDNKGAERVKLLALLEDGVSAGYDAKGGE